MSDLKCHDIVYTEKCHEIVYTWFVRFDFVGCAGSPEGDWSSQRNGRPGLSAEHIVMFVNDDLVNRDAQFLASHIDGRNHIFVNSFWRHTELLAEDIQHRVTTDETHQVVPTSLGLRQWMFGRRGRFRKPNLGLPQSHLRGPSLQLGVAI